MKSGILKLTTVVAVMLVISACASTRTQQSAGEVIDDTVLTSKVKLALIEDPITKARDINVETFRGVVQLGGFVDNTEQRDQATRIARSITGVTEVRNDLRISTGAQTVGNVIDDSALTAAVKATLMEDANTKAYRINVGTQKGIVQLTGFVASSAIRARAGELALSVNGVVDVKNDLEIRQN